MQDVVSAEQTGNADGQRAELRGGAGSAQPGTAGRVAPSNATTLQAAITGAACRLPGARSLEELWELIASGRDSLGKAPPARYEELRLTPKYIESVKKNGHDHGGFIEGIDEFDPTVFGMNYRDSCAADPQQRLLMEVAWEALENACEAPDRVAGSRTGVFVGVSTFDYALFQGAFDPYGELINPYSGPGAAHSIVANRISYTLDLHGPSFAIDTACSSSFYALHMALKSLESGECDAALVCGVQLILTPYITKAFTRARMISPTGTCKTFDQSADGYVRAEGAVAIYLKPLRSATADGSRILGVVTGSAINHDGKTSGMVAPNRHQQVEVIRAAQAAAGVDPSMIGYVEAHGTGTHLGDSIELGALSDVFRGSREQPCYVGSVKSNLGHLEPVSGLAGLIKTLKCFEHETIPAQAHLKTPMKAATIEGARIIVPTASVPWPRGTKPRIAGISSFGFGGANAHIVITEPPLPSAQARGEDRPRHVLKLAAKQADRLPIAARNLKAAIEANPGFSLADICHSANIGRADFAQRAAIAAKDRDELIEALDAIASDRQVGNVFRGAASERAHKTAFMFSGQGSQYAGMARGLMQCEPVFRDTMIEADAILWQAAEFSLLDLLYGKAGSGLSVDDTRFAQPALFAIELGLARLLESWGVKPDLLIGHSIGEYVAAVMDGVMSAEDALELVAARGALMGSVQEAGSMVFAAASAEAVAELLGTIASARIAIAAVNGPQAVVVSGDVASIAAFEAAAKARRIATKRLEVSHAFHSPLMEPILAAFHERASRIAYKPASSRFVSTSLGRPLDAAAGERIDAAYWTEQLRNPVRFWDGLQKAIEAGASILLEVGPQPTLLPVIGGALGGREIVLASCLRKGRDDHAELLGNIGRLYASGLDIDWKAFDAPFVRKRLPLPAYPFARKKFWFNGDAAMPGVAQRDAAASPVAPPAAVAAANDMLNSITPLAETERLAIVARDHVIRGSVLFPATGYLAAMIEPHKDALDGGIEMSDVKFLSALALDDGRFPDVAVSTTRESDDQWLAMLRTAAAEGTPRALARGRVRRLGGKLAGGKAAYETDEPPFELPPEDFYAQLEMAGLGYGPAFRRIRDLKVFAKRAQAEITAAPRGDAAAWPGSIDAAALDACLHPIATLIAQADPEAGGATWIPVAVDRMLVFGAQPSRLIAHAMQEDALQTSMLQSFDVTITDEHGNVWVQMQRVWLQRLTSAQQARPLPLSTMRWRPLDDVPAAAADGAGERAWTLLTLGAQPGALARAVEKATAGARPCAIADIEGLAIQPGLMRNVVLVSEAPANDADPTGLERCKQLLQAVQSLFKRTDIGRVFILTRGAYPVADASEGANPADSAVWGFCRSLQWERNQWNATLVDMPPSSSAADLGTLGRVLNGGAGDLQIAIRDGRLYVPRLAEDVTESEAVASTKLPAEYRLEAVDNTGPLSVRPVPAAVPEPEAGQVRIRPRAMGLNFRDLMKSLGIYPGSTGAAFWLGDECSGVIDAVGRGVEGFAVGDEVIAVAPAAFGSRTVTDARLVVPKPAGISHTEAATIPIVFTTAWHCLVDVAKLAAGEIVLIHAGAGGVGLAAIQIAQMLGAKVVASAGTEEKRNYLSKLGVWQVIDSSTPAFGKELTAKIGERGVDVVLNSLAGPYVEASLEALAPGGRFVEIGKRDFLENTKIGLRPFHKGLRFASVDMERFYIEDRDSGQRLLEAVMAAFERGALRPIPDTVFPLAEAPRAFQKLLRREVIGKVVLTSPDADACEDTDGIAATGRDTYLVTGGLGALGLVAARWLARRGAQRIVLASRSAPSPEVADQIDLLGAKGSLVEAASIDVSSREQLERWLAELDRAGDRLKGVIHAAGVLDDATLLNLDAAQVTKVFRPKAEAACLLHELTRERDLAMFICFSSMSGVVGSPGQCNYSAANAYLDGLCAMRRAVGLPGLSINWGPWDVGMAGSGKTRSRFEQMGLKGITADAGIAALERMVGLAETNVFGADVDWRRFRSTTRHNAGLEILAEVTPEESELETAGTEGGVPVDRASVFQMLRRTIFEVTAVPESDLQESTRFSDIGFDSIVAIELVLRLEKQIGVMPDAQSLSEETTLGHVSDLLVEAMSKSGKRKLAKPATAQAAASAPAKAGSSAAAAPAPARAAAPAPAMPKPVAHAIEAAAASGRNAPSDEGLAGVLARLEHADYTEAIRPDFGAAIREMHFDVDYTRALGDRLSGSRGGETIEAIDMLGGFGSTLFGHNHPALVRVLVEALTEQRPMFAQLSNRTSAGTLARELGLRLGQLTGQDYNTVLGSTGAEMVDAALKHALYEWAERRDAYVASNAPTGPIAPVVMALEGCYHGKTLGAYALTYKAPGRDAIGLAGPFEVVWLPRDNAAAAAEIFARYAMPGSAGEAGFSRIAGLFVEPILGEGGIYPVSSGYAQALRKLADAARCPIIVDEIQSGMGRCGAFAAASIVGISGDYFLFGKSLGGGLTKTCALLIDKRRYRTGFGFAHTSTFGEDDHGALVALRALKLLDEDDLVRRAADSGRYFLGELAKLKSAHPGIIADVRGCGLMIGLELADQSENASPLISGLFKQRLLALIVASHMLHRSGVRVGTALSQPTTLRFEPSAYVSRQEIDATIAALDAACRIVETADAGEFLRHFTHGERLKGPSAYLVRSEAQAADAGSAAVPQSRRKRAVFLGHLIDSNDVVQFDPSLAKLSPSEREKLAERISEPMSLMRIDLAAPGGADVEFEVQSLPFTASALIQSLRNGDSGRIVSLVNHAVRQAAKDGAVSVGLGGLLSVVTRNGLAVDAGDGTPIVTTGNTYTVALARAATLKAVRERGLDNDALRIGIIGAGGNIGSALTQLLTDDFSRFRLAGRRETLVRVERAAEAAYDATLARLRSGGVHAPGSLAAALARTKAAAAENGSQVRRLLREEFGDDPFLPICADIESLDDCAMLVSASNSIMPILTPRNVGKAVRIICDVSVPSDVDPALIEARPDIDVIRGGIALAPAARDFAIDFLDLPTNCMLACMAETAVIGLAGRREFVSIGDINAESVRRCEALATSLGFSLGHASAKKPFAVEL